MSANNKPLYGGRVFLFNHDPKAKHFCTVINTSTPSVQMTPEQKRIAIAEACGWEGCVNNPARGRGLLGLPPDSSFLGLTSAPNYLGDLNAMHAALQSRSQAFRAEFDRLLHALAEEKHLLITELTAQDWADAFIATLGLDK